MKGGLFMKPYKACLMPIEYKIDKELLKIVSQANEKYGEYKSLIKSLEFDPSFFLDSLILNESYKSTQIEGTQISYDEIYYLKYMEANDDNREIQNLKRVIAYAYESINAKNETINFEFVNAMHKMLLDSVRGSLKSPGQIRTEQNWIGPRGCNIENAIFVPPSPECVTNLLHNLYEYMNNAYIDPLLVNVAISHAQFETIHAYKDGNGRLGRALIPIQMSLFDSTEPILYMSEIFELYKPSYQRSLMEYRLGNVEGYIKFFLQCVVDQCTSYIYKINRIKEIHKKDSEKIKSFKGSTIYQLMPIISKQVVFTRQELVDLSGVSANAVARTLRQLLDANIIEKDDGFRKKGYKYKEIYDVFVTSK